MRLCEGRDRAKRKEPARESRTEMVRAEGWRVEMRPYCRKQGKRVSSKSLTSELRGDT